MIKHTPGASPSLSTQILLALDELQKMGHGVQLDIQGVRGADQP